MELRVLGSAGSEAPGFNPPAFLIDDFLLLDAGTVSLALDRTAQCRITHILLTHAHFDHIKGIPFLADNLVSLSSNCQVLILSGNDVISNIRENIFNNKIWPDFAAIPDMHNPVLKYQEITTDTPITIKDYRIRATRVNHSVPAYGYLVENRKGALLYTGDTGPTEAIWKMMPGHDIKVLIIEVSFPDELTELALTTGHLTPALLEQEIRKMSSIPERIYVSHMKPHYRAEIQTQLARIPGVNLRVLEEGETLKVT